MVTIGDYNYYYWSDDGEVRVNVVDRTKTSYDDILDQVTIGGQIRNVTSAKQCFESCTFMVESPKIPNTIVDMDSCFYGCRSLTKPPNIPDSVKRLSSCFKKCSSLVNPPIISSDCNVENMASCFYGCDALSSPPLIPDEVWHMGGCFYECGMLRKAPIIPNKVTELNNCFYNCRSLRGKVEVYNNSAAYYRIFEGTVSDIFIINKGLGELFWKTLANDYANVHYEADDNPIPVVSNLSAIRVSSDGSTTQESTGLYAYIQARIMTYETMIPAGWTNEFKDSILKDNGAVETVTWQPSPITEYPADIHCWIYLGDTSTHSISLQIYDSVKEDGIEKRSSLSVAQTINISKSYALVDYYHGPNVSGNSEGMSIGKYAEYADLFDVDMPTMFRQVITSQTWAGFVQMFAGATAPSGWLFCDGSEVAVADYPLLHAVIGNTYGTPSDSDHFLLPDLKNRFPVGAGSTYALNSQGGSEYIQEHSHSFTQPTVDNGGGTNNITGGSHHHATYRKKNAGSGSAIYVPDGGSTANGISTTGTTHTHSLPNHTHRVHGGDVTAVKDVAAGNGGNLPPYIGINFIICTGETS